MIMEWGRIKEGKDVKLRGKRIKQSKGISICYFSLFLHFELL